MAENDEKAAEAAPKKDGRPVITRRALCVGLGGTAALVGLGAVRYAGSAPLVRPPGGQDEDALVSACIRCEKCYEVCPRGVIAPAHLEDGLLNMRTCPTEALKPGSTPETGVLGLAELNQDLCLAYRLIGCRFCYDACEYEAMALDENNRPYVLNDACNGCGACESVCVSLQNGSISAGATERAIVVRPLEA